MWLIHNRSQYRLLKSGKKSSISDEKIAQFEKLGFKWNNKNQLALDISLNEHVSERMNFKQQWGNCDVPHNMLRNQSLGSG